MNKPNKINLIYCNRKFGKDLIYNNLSPRMSDPAFQINNTLRQYINRKLDENENLLKLEKEQFTDTKINNKKLKSIQGIVKRNNDTNNNTYFTNSPSKENMQLFSSVRNLSLSIVQNNKNNENLNVIKSMIFNNKDKAKEKNNKKNVFSCNKINDKKASKIKHLSNSCNRDKKKKNKNKNKNLKLCMSGKIPRIKTMNKFRKNNIASSMTDIIVKKITNITNTDNKNKRSNVNNKYEVVNECKTSNTKEKKYNKTFTRFNSSDFKNINNENININIKSSNRSNNNSKNKNLTLSRRISNIATNRVKKNTSKNKNKKHIENKNNIKNDKKIKKLDKRNILAKISHKNSNKFMTNFTNNNSINITKEKFKKLNKDIKENYCCKKISKINSNIMNSDRDSNGYPIHPKVRKTKTYKTDSKTNNDNKNKNKFRFKEEKNLDGYELCWNLKNDYSKDIDISLISINNQKKPCIKNYKLCPNKIYNTFNNDNNNINNIYLNNIQNVNNINNINNISHKQENLSNKNKEKYYSKIVLLENENKILKDEIKESKNRISVLENKIEELLDDKNSKENSVCPQPTPYVVKYSKDILSSKIKDSKNKTEDKIIYNNINEVI